MSMGTALVIVGVLAFIAFLIALVVAVRVYDRMELRREAHFSSFDSGKLDTRRKGRKLP